ncbi:MAG: DegT/DnrJ/EryC1/StrS family aminotransferase [Planctomycetes bacterium]|nr:DegT/DnrJ/EryC1/StrS family aminotransferase [Planctomycetota bacterium]
MTEKQLPLARPNITQVEIDAVVAVLESSDLSLGPKLPAFEEAFADQCRRKHAVACSSGTCALHLLIRAMGIRDGDEVITTPFSFIASANCALIEGAKPVFVDIDPHTWNIDPARIEAAVTPKTKAILPVDVFGQMVDMDAILDIAHRHDLRMIEDSCEALGSTYKGKPAGSFGDAGVFGFYPNKQITTGEGGMIVTDDAALARLSRSLRNQGRDGNGGWLAHPRLGFNYRISDINCALGIAQLHRLTEIASERTRVYELYQTRLGPEKRLTLQGLRPGVTPNWFVFVVRLANRYNLADRDRILVSLREKGIGCSNYFAPIHLQPFYVEEFGYRRGDFPVCEALADRTVALPFHHELSSEDVDRVCGELRNQL